MSASRRTRVSVEGVELVVFSEPTPSLDELGLTASQLEVVGLVLAGATNAEIAERRGTSPRTVEKQISACLRRLGVGSRAELVATLTGRVDGRAGGE